MAKYHQGLFRPNNPQKYKGDWTKIVYRSSWEYRFMKWLDDNPNVLIWASEEFHIPYESPADKKMHRYFPDIIFKMKDKYGKETTYLTEIKPHAQANVPERKQKKHKTFMREAITYGINQAKWEAAKIYCAKRGWEFRVTTEKNTPWIAGKK